MSKELPYFKFVATEWLTGEIVYESLEVQGLFINICALYWKKFGSLSLEEVEKRFRRKSAIEALKNRFFTVTDGMVYIKFLEEQLSEHEGVSKRNSQNAREGWEKRNAKKNATPLRNDATACDPIAKRCNIEKEKEEELEKEKKEDKEEEKKKELFEGKPRPRNEYHDVFDSWFYSISGVKYSMQKKDWVGLAEIKKFCEDNCKNGNPKDSFAAVLARYKDLPKFFQENRNPSFMASRFAEIIAILKNPTKREGSQDSLVNMFKDAQNLGSNSNLLTLMQ